MISISTAEFIFYVVIVMLVSLGKLCYSWIYSKIVCMKKMLACYYFWCPSLDETIENYVRQCDTCQINQNMSY